MTKKKKVTRSHTTIIEAAKPLINTLEFQKEVKKISLGIIKNGLRCARGERRIKIGDLESNALRLAVRGNFSHQQIIIYTDDPQQTKECIAKKSRDLGYHISFG